MSELHVRTIKYHIRWLYGKLTHSKRQIRQAIVLFWLSQRPHIPICSKKCFWLALR
jgi:hypothetical protein